MFETHLLDGAVERRAERLEAERTDLLDRTVRALRAEGPRLGVSEAYVVGSLAKEGQWVEGSDVDVAISGGDPIEVMKRIEEVTGRAVDVIDMDRHPHPGMVRRRGMKVVG